jgi:hypothetical protein
MLAEWQVARTVDHDMSAAAPFMLSWAGCVPVTSTVLMGDFDGWYLSYDSISSHAGTSIRS